MGTPYTSTLDSASPFIINQLVFQATNASNAATSIVLNASSTGSIRLAGTSPQILENGVGPITIDIPIQLTANTTFGGSSTGVVTLNRAVSGAFDITKTGTNVFRFGSADNLTPSDNTWFGTMNLQGGTIRFNNNEVAARTALRSNPFVMTAGTTLTSTSEIRVGALTGAGTVTTQPTGTNLPTESIVIHAIQNGSFGGAIGIGAPASGTNYKGNIIVRAGSQTFTGSIGTQRGDVQIGYGATVTLAGTASLGAQSIAQGAGGIVLNGGSFVLDNTTTNNSNRLRDGAFSTTGAAQPAVDSTIIDNIGGGSFTLIGNAAGTQELTTRLQLGSVNNQGNLSKARSGALSINIVHQSTTAATTLSFAAYTRDSFSTPQYSTVDFTARNGSGTTLNLGTAGSNPRIFLNAGGAFAVPLGSGNMLNGTNATANDVGWATVNGTDFATHGTNGVAAVTTTAQSNGSTFGLGSTTTNYSLNGNVALNSGNASMASTKLNPSAAGQSFTIAAGATLATRGFVMGGNFDYSIAGAGQITGTTTRFFHVKSANLTVDAAIAGTAAVVKAGEGTLTLTNAANAASSAPVILNQGQIRASLGALPTGEMRMRGGVLEVAGGGTFNRSVGFGANSVNWSGADISGGIDEDRGSGGFAAIGADLTVDLGAGSQTDFAWEQTSFVNSGHALVFGSAAATNKVNWVDNLSLTAASGTANYNAREIRVLDNSAVTTDRLQLSGSITGTVRDDLLKTGTGVLELSGNNSYGGATLVKQGTLLVNGTNSASFLTQVMNGATLGGTGSLKAVRVEAGATLAPGEISGSSQAANLTLNGDLSFVGATSNFAFELGTGVSDKLTVNGSVLLQGAQLVGSLLNGFAAQPNDLFFLIINDGTDAVQGTFAQGSSIVIGGMTFQIGYGGDSGSNSFSGGNDVVLRAIPEPSSAALLIGALGMFGAKRMRRRR